MSNPAYEYHGTGNKMSNIGFGFEKNARLYHVLGYKTDPKKNCSVQYIQRAFSKFFQIGSKLRSMTCVHRLVTVRVSLDRTVGHVYAPLTRPFIDVRRFIPGSAFVSTIRNHRSVRARGCASVLSWAEAFTLGPATGPSVMTMGPDCA
jgi:hypothetical protein